MKVLTAAQMREIDRRTVEMGIPGIVPMENAGHPSSEIIARVWKLCIASTELQDDMTMLVVRCL